MIRRPPRSTRKESSAASDVYKRQEYMGKERWWSKSWHNDLAPKEISMTECGTMDSLRERFCLCIKRKLRHTLRYNATIPIILLYLMLYLSLIHISEPTRPY
eukprot:TRINITY_DN1972_c0_g1_i7.p1 TRINITY_DN1972_c0_g1~~TRINITY_DN1972_c0_g1_i7.p1  ORF type:complete len:109 (+),score=14.00 TRINITY_DN1972_c0_g1_i7:23-328(+)